MELYPLIDSVTRHLDRLSCRVGIGLPFGGYRRSGFGREQGVEALASYTQIKNIMINYGSG